MPPLAHLLAPQIAQRVNQIDEDLGNAGYLSRIGFEKTPYDPRGLVDKPEQKSYDSRKAMGGVLEGVGIMQRSGDPIAQKVARAFLAGPEGKTVGTQGSYRAPQAGQAISPKGKAGSQSMVVPMPGKSEPIGWTETGEPIYADVKSGPKWTSVTSPPPGKLKLKKGAAAGIDETGQSVDPRGKKLGYLASPTAPMGAVTAPGREMPLRDLARRKTDAPIDRRDVFGAQSLKQLYAPHLKAMQDNFMDTGKEDFPPGYFNGMSPEQKQEILNGVKSLREMERGQPA